MRKRVLKLYYIVINGFNKQVFDSGVQQSAAERSGIVLFTEAKNIEGYGDLHLV